MYIVNIIHEYMYILFELFFLNKNRGNIVGYKDNFSDQ